VKLLALLLLVLVVVAVVFAVAAWLGRRRRGGRWELDERSDGGRVAVHAVRPGEAPLLVGAVPFADPDFDMRIEEVRAEGRYKVAALNSGRRL
jgi:hypothetical protein